jgi:hypothetical protein
MRLLAFVLASVVACGGNRAKPVEKLAPDPIPKTAGPSCKEVTAHLATLADRDPAEDAKANESLRARCNSDGWSDEARSCFATATSDEEVDGCKTKLTTQQLTAFPTQEKPAAADSWSAPNEGSKTTRGPVPKTKTKKDSDPCEGGQ